MNSKRNYNQKDLKTEIRFAHNISVMVLLHESFYISRFILLSIYAPFFPVP